MVPHCNLTCIQASSFEDPFSLAGVQFLLLSWVVGAVKCVWVLALMMVKKLLGGREIFMVKNFILCFPLLPFNTRK